MAAPTIGARPNLTSPAVTQQVQTMTGAQLATMAPTLVRQQWVNGFHFGERNADPYLQLEGTGKDSIIAVDRTAANGRGTIVNFGEQMRYVKSGKFGDAIFESGASFETPTVTGWSVRLDLLRHALSGTQYAEEINGMRNELSTSENELQGEWMGNRQSEITEACLCLSATGDNVEFAGNKTWTTLASSDTLSYDDVIDATNIISSYVKPATITRRGQNTVRKYMFMCPTPGLSGLEKELINSNIITMADERGSGNFVFAGGWIDLRGQAIMERQAIDEAAMGPLGTPLAPHAKLGEAITAAAGALTIKGNIKSQWKDEPETEPFRLFPGHSYRYNSFEQFDVTGSLATNTWQDRPRYVIIINLTGADKGKWGMYEFANNHNGQSLTVTKRLGATTDTSGSNIQYQTIGGVTWSAAINTAAHPEGSAILPCTEDGVTYCGNLILGARALMRAYGKAGVMRTQERVQDIIYRRYIGKYFGQGPTYDVSGRMQGYRMRITAAPYPQFPRLS